MSAVFECTVIVASHSSALVPVESQYSFSPGQKLEARTGPCAIRVFSRAGEPADHKLKEKEKKGSAGLRIKLSLIEFFNN